MDADQICHKAADAAIALAARLRGRRGTGCDSQEAHPAVQVYKYFDAAKKALADWMDLSSLEGASMDNVRTEGRKPMAQMV